MMTKVTKALVLVAVLTTLTACDRAQQLVEAKNERADADYRAAMADYEAGRLEAALKGLEKVVRDDPGNASARFQLACLKQDSKKDYLGAIHHYREYALLAPKSDKAELALERSRLCERNLGLELAEKLNLTDNAAVVAEADKIKAESERIRKVNAELARKLEETGAQLTAVKREAENYRKIVKGVNGDEDERAPVVSGVKDLLEEEEEDDDKTKLSRDVKRLLAEEKEEAETPFAPVANRKSAKAKADKSEPPHETRPDTYVIQEGDSLMKIATRFYGKRSAWVKIRDANKAIITTDGRVRKGDRIRLP